MSFGNMSGLDWAIIIVSVVALRLVSLSTRKYVSGVANFLSANRSANRYLLTIASQMGSCGTISFVAAFEMYHQAGFTPLWWSLMHIPVSVIVLMTGWVFYRFRETRAMTMAQFFEMRYSRRFRIFAGLLAWSCGILNFGIFPAVTARFFIYFCGLPDYYHIAFIPFDISTFATAMALDLAVAVMIVTKGGQITVMITDCVQGIFSSFAFLIITAVTLMVIGWPNIISAVSTAPAKASMIHPFHTSQMKDFNVWYFAIGIYASFYVYMSWQGSQGFYSSARTPHEQKMGGIIALWRAMPQHLMTMILPIAAFTLLALPEFSDKAAAVNQTLKSIDNEAIKGQMRVPVALAYILPIGIKGLLATVMLFFSFTCHDSYLHSWGSIFIQDVVMPIRKKPLRPEEHIKWLRRSIIGVAVFSFFFSLLYPQTHKIIMFMAITGTIWMGGSGAVIIGGLYWKRGTTAAAYCALISGAILGVTGLVLPPIYQNHLHREFPVNGQVLWFIAMVSSLVIYFIVSLLTGGKRKEFNLEKLLGRGSYARSREPIESTVHQSKWMQLIGITKEFSFGDKVLAIALITWNGLWFTFFAVVSVANLISPFSNAWWANLWHRYIYMYLIIGIPATIWFAIGGISDIKSLFKTLDNTAPNHLDNGSVTSEPEVGQETIPAPGTASDLNTAADVDAELSASPAVLSGRDDCGSTRS